MADDLAILTSREGPIGFVRLSGEARLEVVDAMRQGAMGLLEGGARHLVLSVADLSFVDSASVGVILEVQREVEGRGGRLVLASPPARLRRQFEQMGLLHRLALAPDEKAARSLLR
jgi:stage II sporulation protein AA (anti-sigma F factor antagonist)